jgi:hypothetical protein
MNTDGAHGLKMFTIGRRFFVAFANFGDRQGQRYNAVSEIWQYAEGSSSHFGDDDSLCTASSSNNTDSHICEEKSSNKEGTGSMDMDRVHENSAPFSRVAAIETHGATDCEFFTVGSHHYIGFSEEGNFNTGDIHKSSIYEVILI